MTGPDPEPPSRDTVPGDAAGRLARIAAIAVIVGLVVLVFVRREGEDRPEGSAVPQGVTTVAPPADPLSDGQGPLPTEGVIGQGTAGNGATWILTITKPPAEVCLTIEVVDGTGGQPTACSALAAAGSLPAEVAYRPQVHGDDRVPPFVFGRLPPGVTEVEVILADGGSLGRVPVARGVGGPFYAVEVTGGSTAIAAFGYQPDGTSVRFDLPR